jgi:serine/threonine-protein kinase
MLCGSMSDDDRLAAGQMFGRYQIVRVLGEGGMGVVYEAIHPVLKKRFAIKTLLPAVAELPSVRARFLREGEATARIDHPHIVDVVDVGEQDGMPFLVMEFLEGQTLAELIAARGRLPVAEAIDLLLPVLSAVAAGHAHGVVHRDLKPANIFLARGPWGDRFPKVLDFGISKLIGDAQGGPLTGTLTVLGTAAYMSPEQTRGAREIDGRSDQYSLGLILYEMLTGRRAHDGEHALEVLHNIASGVFKAPRLVQPDLPIALEKIMLRMMALDAAARFPSLLEAGRALLPLASEKARLTLGDAFSHATEPADARSAAPPPTGPRAPEPPATTTFREAAAQIEDGGRAGRRGPRLALITLGGAVVAGAVGWMLVSRMPPEVAPATKAAAAAAPAAPAASAVPAPQPPRPAPQPAPPASQPLPPIEKPAAPPAPPTVAASAAPMPTHHVHHKKPARVTAAAPAPAAHDTADAPKRGANNALIIK